MSSRADLPIGVFDSGVGGLTVARALMARMPNESVLYFGDTARVPYGVKSAETIAEFAVQIVRFLLEREVKLLVVACNTMAAVARRAIADISPVPVLDVIHASAKGAVEVSRTQRIAVIGTLATIQSEAYEHAIHYLQPAAQILSQPCPLFVPLVEEGWLEHPVTRLTAREYLEPVRVHRADTLVLGCTHYPLLRRVLQEVAGFDVHLVDSADTMAAEAQALLEDLGLARRSAVPPQHHYFVTDVPQRFRAVGERFLGHALSALSLVKL